MKKKYFIIFISLIFLEKNHLSYIFNDYFKNYELKIKNNELDVKNSHYNPFDLWKLGFHYNNNILKKFRPFSLLEIEKAIEKNKEKQKKHQENVDAMVHLYFSLEPDRYYNNKSTIKHIESEGKRNYGNITISFIKGITFFNPLITNPDSKEIDLLVNCDLITNRDKTPENLKELSFNWFFWQPGVSEQSLLLYLEGNYDIRKYFKEALEKSNIQDVKDIKICFSRQEESRRGYWHLFPGPLRHDSWQSQIEHSLNELKNCILNVLSYNPIDRLHTVIDIEFLFEFLKRANEKNGDIEQLSFIFQKRITYYKSSWEKKFTKILSQFKKLTTLELVIPLSEDLLAGLKDIEGLSYLSLHNNLGKGKKVEILAKSLKSLKKIEHLNIISKYGIISDNMFSLLVDTISSLPLLRNLYLNLEDNKELSFSSVVDLVKKLINSDNKKNLQYIAIILGGKKDMTIEGLQKIIFDLFVNLPYLKEFEIDVFKSDRNPETSEEERLRIFDQTYYHSRNIIAKNLLEIDEFLEIIIARKPIIYINRDMYYQNIINTIFCRGPCDIFSSFYKKFPESIFLNFQAIHNYWGNELTEKERCELFFVDSEEDPLEVNLII